MGVLRRAFRNLQSTVLHTRAFSALPNAPLLLREFIYKSLYDVKDGYFSKHANIGAESMGIQDPIPFQRIYDMHDYMAIMSQLYNKGHGAWLTPVEAFHPWYGIALARHIMEKVDPGQGPLRVIEIGGGSGRCLVDVMQHIREREPSLFKDMKYTSIEISERLAEVQRAKAGKAEIPDTNWEVVNSDFMSMDESLSASGNTFVIMLEVLDNLPHDKVIFDAKGDAWQAEIYPITVPESPDILTPKELLPFRHRKQRDVLQSETHVELFRRVDDPLILKCLDILERGEQREDRMDHKDHLQQGTNWFEDMASKLSRSSNARYSMTGEMFTGSAVMHKFGTVYLPTCQIDLLTTLARCIPSHKIIMSDFNALPEKTLPGSNGPAIQATTDGRIEEVGSYMDTDFGCADIFFPTDFWALKCAYEEIVGSHAQIHTPRQFLGRFEDLVEKTTTLSRYCPLLDYYGNTMFLTS